MTNIEEMLLCGLVISFLFNLLLILSLRDDVNEFRGWRTNWFLNKDLWLKEFRESFLQRVDGADNAIQDLKQKNHNLRHKFSNLKYELLMMGVIKPEVKPKQKYDRAKYQRQ